APGADVFLFVGGGEGGGVEDDEVVGEFLAGGVGEELEGAHFGDVVRGGVGLVVDEVALARVEVASGDKDDGGEGGGRGGGDAGGERAAEFGAVLGEGLEVDGTDAEGGEEVEGRGGFGGGVEVTRGAAFVDDEDGAVVVDVEEEAVGAVGFAGEGAEGGAFEG